MRRLMLDYFRRWSWLLGLCALFTFAQGWLFTAHENLAFEFWILLATMWSGANLLLLDQQRGAARVAAMLPLTARQVGRGWWLATVAIPAVTLASLLCLGSAACSHYHPDRLIPWERLALASLLILVWLGSFFTAIQGAPPHAYGRFREMSFDGLLGFLSTFMMLGSLLLCRNATQSTLKCTLLLSIGTFLTVAGWLRTERFALIRIQSRLPLNPCKGPRSEHRVPVGCGGLLYLIKTNFIRIFFLIAAMNALMALVAMLIPHPGPEMPRRLSVVMAVKMGGFMSCGFIIVFQLMSVVRHLSFLRTMPVSATRLAAMMLAIPILPIVALCGLAAGAVWCVWGSALALALVKSSILLLAPAALCVFFAVWGGNSTEAHVMMILILFGFLKVDGWLVVWSKNPEIPLGLAAPIAAASVLLSFFLTRWAIRRSGRPYRVLSNPFGSLPWGAGR